MQFDCAARDYCAARIMAHEYLDDDAVLKEKVAKLAGLVRRSRDMLAFTGAGISTAAGIDDYASKAKTSSVTAAGKPVVKDWKDAQPTLAHRVLAALHAAGHLKHWIQQNHDSLPQKAGYPQHALNEIHGSLHDPANPIVPYEGSLRDDLYAWMQEWEARQDLCLALGTSLSGFNVDRVAESASDAFAQGRGLGLVIVNLQATPYDAGSALRIWARIDDVMSLLAAELGIEPAPPPTQDAPPPPPAPPPLLSPTPPAPAPLLCFTSILQSSVCCPSVVTIEGGLKGSFLGAPPLPRLPRLPLGLIFFLRIGKDDSAVRQLPPHTM